jgi:hypothetical protein
MQSRQLWVGVLLAVAGLSGCGGDKPPPPPGRANTATTAPTTTPAPATAPVTATSAPVTPTATPDDGGATAAPTWLGTRVLPIGPDGFGVSPGTPKELRNRRIITKDLLPPPADGGFHSRIQAVPAAVVKRSSWSSDCPVKLDQLRYLTLSFVGFDRRVHTGELLVNRSVATDVVTVFRKLYQAGWPIEEMRIASAADLAAKPTGDGNTTSAFACRPVRSRLSTWSQHAYGLAIDVDPFQNPYVDGRTVLPELATAYTERGRGLPGMITPGSAPDLAFRSVGWGWGGTYSAKKDWMHFSSTGK